MPIINQVVKGSGGGIPSYIAPKGNVNGSYTANNTATTFNVQGASTINGHTLYGAFDGCTNLTSFDFDSVTTIFTNACYSCFSNCSGLVVANIPNLIKINSGGLQKAFSGCSNIVSFDFNNLVVADGNSCMNQCFQNNSALTTIGLDKLVYVGYNAMQDMFDGCTSLGNVIYKSMKTLASGAVDGLHRNSGTGITSISFPALTTNSFGTLTNQFNNMLYGCTDVVVHFPSNLQSVIGSWTSVTGGFCGTNTTVLYDLPATVILTGDNTTEYERSPKDDTQTALAWRVKDTGTTPAPIIDWTPFYTNGTTDPQVNDTIYSDSACTTAVTTISAIA